MAAQEPPSIAISWILDRLTRHRGAAEQFVADPEGEAGNAAVRRRCGCIRRRRACCVA